MSKKKGGAKPKDGQVLTAIWPMVWKLLGGGGLLAVVIGAFGWFNYAGQYRHKLDEGNDLLKLGLYPQAKESFQQAISLHPLRHVVLLSKVFGEQAGEAVGQAPDLLAQDQEAQWGLAKASAFDSGNPQYIELKLQALHPQDADVQVLWGRFHAAQLHYDQAEPY